MFGSGLTFFEFFRIFYADFKKKSRRRAWPFIARGWILRKYWCISDEIGSCVPKNDFYEKSRENYEAHVVQIWPVSTWIGRNLCFSKEVDETFSVAKIWLFVHITWYSSLKKYISQFFQHICGWCFAKKPIFHTRKMENGLDRKSVV